MKINREYRQRRAQEFVDHCEKHGIKFNIHDDELCVTFLEGASKRLSMIWFSDKLRWLNDEIIEYVVRRKKDSSHLKLYSVHGRRV